MKFWHSEKYSKSKHSIKDASFLSRVSKSLDEEDFVVVHIDHGGPQDYYLIRSVVDLKKTISVVQSKDIITIFTKRSITIKGKADSDLLEQTLKLLSKLHIEDSDESVIAIRIDSAKTKLSWGGDWIQLSTAKEAKEWFNKNHGHSIIVFTPAWINDEI